MKIVFQEKNNKNLIIALYSDQDNLEYLKEKCSKYQVALISSLNLTHYENFNCKVDK